MLRNRSNGPWPFTAPGLVRPGSGSSNGLDEGKAMPPDRQRLAGSLRRPGYPQAADDAERELLDQVSLEEMQTFAARHGLSRDEVISRMGGSP